MKIGLRAGHSPNCKGAMGIVDEYLTNIAVYNKVAPILTQYGHTVINCNTNASSSKAELTEGTNKANANNCDIYVSIHCNAFNRQAYGTEALIYDNNSTKAKIIGQRFCSNFAYFGYANRGLKTRGNELHELRETKMEAIIFEMFFCDNQSDVNKFNACGIDAIAYAIANAIDPNIPRVKPQEQPKPTNKTITIDELKRMGYTEIKL